jgi:tripartite ATP-independent transporter DctP family solute receptor
MATRRDVLRGALAGAAFMGTPALVRGQSSRTLRFSHTDTPQGAAQKAAELFAERVGQYTEGRYRVQVFHSGQVANDQRSLEQLQVGGLDFALTGVVTFTTHVRPLSLIALPYLAETYEQGWKLYDSSGFIKAQKEALAQHRMRFVGDWEAGFRSFTTTFPIASPADLKGKKVRIAPVEMVRWIMETLEANAVVMPVTEVYLAIQQGTVLGQENPVDTIYSQRFYEVAKNITLSQHVYSPRWVAIADRTYQSLTPQDREAVMRAGKEAGDFNRQEVRKNDDALLAEMTSKGATVTKPNLADWRRAVEPVYERARREYGAESVNQILRDAEAIRS